MTRFAVWLVRLWIRLYTLGLESGSAETRRLEIESDLIACFPNKNEVWELSGAIFRRTP